MIDYSLNEIAIIVLDFYDGLEYKHKHAILSNYSTPSDIFLNPKWALDYVAKNISEGAMLTVKNSLLSDEYRNYVIEKLNKKGVVAVTYLSDGYPEIFSNLPMIPLVIYAKGNLELLKAKNTFGIVGSRKTLPFVLRAGENIAREISSSGVVVVSGSAVGGDRSALLGASESGNVISILASGHEHVSPQSNRDLIDKISKNGLVISEYPPETPSTPWRFPMRNRLISALSNGVLILSGEIESGTRHTAKFAEAYSKRLYAIPYSLGEKSGEICNMLIKMGKAQLVENAQDVADYEGIELQEELDYDLEEDEIRILSVMDGSTHIDDIALKTGKKSYEISPVLSMMEIKGIVSKEPNNHYVALIKITKA